MVEFGSPHVAHKQFELGIILPNNDRTDEYHSEYVWSKYESVNGLVVISYGLVQKIIIMKGPFI